jgi:xanthine dehydrogenase molybdenum-binding subunit
MCQVSGLSREEIFKPHMKLETPHLVRSWGFAAAYKNTGLGGGAPDKSGADVELYADGTFQVRSSAAELGQGLVTVMRLIVSEEMAVAPEKVRVLVMDTDLTPNGGPTTASRQTFVTGNASRYAAKLCAMRLPPRWQRNMM